MEVFSDGRDKLQRGLRQFVRAAEICAQANLQLPALILFYSAVDVAGWLDSPSRRATAASFKNWANCYLLRDSSLKCNADDLYAARCGLLHTFSPQSNKSRAGVARQLCLAWGQKRAEELQVLIEHMGKTEKYVAVHVEDLIDRLSVAVERFLADLERRGDRAKVAEEKAASSFYSELPPEVVSIAREIIKTQSDTQHSP